MPPERGRGQLSLGGRDGGAGAPRMGSGAGEPGAVKMRCAGRPGPEQTRRSQACGLYPCGGREVEDSCPTRPQQTGAATKATAGPPASAQGAGAPLLDGLAVSSR